MAAEEFIMNAYGIIVSWTYVLLTILLVVKIVQLFSGGSLFSGKGRENSGDEASKRSEDDISPDDKKKRERDEAEGKPEGLDFNNPGLVQVIVRDEDDNPIRGAKVRITPARMHKKRWLRTKQDWREYGGVTGPDGVWPGGGRYEQVGSGSATVSVTKEEWVNLVWWGGGKFYQKKDYEIIPSQQHDIVVIMARKGEKADGSEPYILEVTPESGRIKLRGIIK